MSINPTSRSIWFGPVLGLLVAAVAAFGCAGVHGGNGSIGPGDGGAAANGAGGSSGTGGRRSGTGGASPDDVNGTTMPPPNCGITRHTTERLPPDVLIVLDRSLSMNDQVKPIMDLAGLLGCLGMPCPSKWQDMTTALNTSVAASATTVNWGLKFFPEDSSCTVSDMVAVPVAPNNASAVSTAIGGQRPGGLTPTTAALQAAGRYLMSLTDASPRFVVLATDGEPNCGGGNGQTTDAQAAVDSVTALARAGIPVFVIGVATQGGADAGPSPADTTLSSMAVAGGKPRNATPAYYPVERGADLTAALQAIGSQVVSCTFEIPPPPDPSNIAVDADGMRVPKDAANGWSYGPNMTSIVLNGSWCTSVQNGTVTNVEAIFACGMTIIP